MMKSSGVKFKATEWSDSAKVATQVLFETQNFMSPDNRVWLKHIEGHTGYIKLADALQDIYRVFSRDRDEALGLFPSVESLLDAGWVAD